MDQVAQGAVWSQITEPILDANGDPITNGVGSIVVTLYDRTGTDQSTGVTVTHIAGGKYLLEKTLASDATLRAWTGTMVYDDGSLLGWEQEIDFTVVTAAQADPAGALSGQSVTVTSPLLESDSMTIVRGDDYLHADGRAVTWDFTDAPSLSGATVTWTMTSAGTTVLTKTLTVVDGDTARLELSSADTAALRWGVFAFTVTMVDGDDTATLLTGSVTIL